MIRVRCGHEIHRISIRDNNKVVFHDHDTLSDKIFHSFSSVEETSGFPSLYRLAFEMQAKNTTGRKLSHCYGILGVLKLSFGFNLPIYNNFNYNYKASRDLNIKEYNFITFFSQKDKNSFEKIFKKISTQYFSNKKRKTSYSVDFPPIKDYQAIILSRFLNCEVKISTSDFREVSNLCCFTSLDDTIYITFNRFFLYKIFTRYLVSNKNKVTHPYFIVIPVFKSFGDYFSLFKTSFLLEYHILIDKNFIKTKKLYFGRKDEDRIRIYGLI